ncbi:hypothetical protein ABEB36_000604 [Hypothenemus hampei]
MLIVNLSIRLSFSVAIVAMTTNGTSTERHPNVAYYNWNNTNIILSSFYWSYAVLQFSSGNVIHFLGTKKVLFLTTFVNAGTSALLPLFAANAGSNGVMALRVIQGIFQAFIFPSTNAMLGRWMPPQELSFINSVVFSGYHAGVITSTIITGYLSASSWGWPSAFYLFGALGFVWCPIWIFLSADSPGTHPSITIEERKYIEESLDQQDDHLIKKKSIPWRAIACSIPYYALIIASVGESWCTTFLSTELPNFLNKAVGLSIQDSGLLTAGPTVGALLGSFFYSPIAGYTIKKGWISTVNSRKSFQAYSLFSVGFGLIGLSYISNTVAITFLLIFICTASSAVQAGHVINHIDLSPRYTAALSGISNGFGQLIAILAPFLVHYIVVDETDKTSWSYTFILSAIIGISTTIFFLIFCSTERQWWDDKDKKRLNKAGTQSSERGITNPGFEDSEK